MRIFSLLLFIFLSLSSISQKKVYHLTYSDTLMILGEKAYKSHDFIAAIPALDSCIGLNPINDQCRYTRAKIALEMNEFVLAENLLKSVIALTPKDAAAWNLLGLSMTELKKYDSAILCYQNSVALNASNSKFFANWAKNEYLRGDLEHADRLYGTAIFLEPSYASHFKNRAEVRKKLGKKEDALADIDEAIKLNPNDEEAISKRNEIEGYDLLPIFVFGISFFGILAFIYFRRKSKSEL
jgi:tetratricopeptide (TPR) repeat protein